MIENFPTSFDTGEDWNVLHTQKKITNISPGQDAAGATYVPKAQSIYSFTPVYCRKNSPNFQGLILMKNALTNQVGMLGDMFLWLVANLKQWPFTQ